jgi:Na+-transporting NADH:ubiquinone oxidoreductase subunit B
MDLMASRNRTTPPSAEGGAPPVRSGTNVRALSVLEFVALLPPLVVAALERGNEWLWVLIVAIFSVLICQRFFAEVRRRCFTPDGIVTAIACAIVLPTSIPLWQVALSLGFGIVVGQEIFGGRGRNFLNPGTVALAFYIFSFPGGMLEVPSPAIGLSVIPGALLLVTAGLISPRVILGAVVGLLLTAALATTAPMTADMVSASFIFGLVFFAADPIAAASTNSGRWIYGVFFGTTAALLAGGGAPSVETIVSAGLLAGVLAPLIDSGIIEFNAYQRGRRNE